ncbi:UNVERIFIED_CONTAM: hypothetical protein Sradi_4120800 [Sesamum radiatum]|uniref:Uncharacterized protein n=1 Tax=Sesamum radiatum TaxID=300843 RepID=A0AAW2P4U0_SESRA
MGELPVSCSLGVQGQGRLLQLPVRGHLHRTRWLHKLGLMSPFVFESLLRLSVGWLPTGPEITPPWRCYVEEDSFTFLNLQGVLLLQGSGLLRGLP